MTIKLYLLYKESIQITRAFCGERPNMKMSLGRDDIRLGRRGQNTPSSGQYDGQGREVVERLNGERTVQLNRMKSALGKAETMVIGEYEHLERVKGEQCTDCLVYKCDPLRFLVGCS